MTVMRGRVAVATALVLLLAMAPTVSAEHGDVHWESCDGFGCLGNVLWSGIATWVRAIFETLAGGTFAVFAPAVAAAQGIKVAVTGMADAFVAGLNTSRDAAQAAAAAQLAGLGLAAPVADQIAQVLSIVPLVLLLVVLVRLALSILPEWFEEPGEDFGESLGDPDAEE